MTSLLSTVERQQGPVMPGKLFLTLFFILACWHTAAAQLHRSDSSRDRTISLGYTTDAFAAIELEYAENPGILQKNNFHMYTRVSFPVLLAIKDESFDTWQLKAGIRSDLFADKKLGAIGDIRLFMMHHDQVLGSFIPLGVNIQLTPCCYFAKGYLGIQFTWNRVIATHISHSRYVDNTFTDITDASGREILLHPQGGWYGSTGSHVSIGIENRWDLGSKFSLYGDVGIMKFSSPYTGMFDAMMMGQVPFYGHLRLYYTL